MKKSLLSVGAASLAIAMFATGCGTPSGADAKELNDFIIGSRAAEVIEKTNDQGIDAIADSSTVIYKRVGGMMREHIEKIHGDLLTRAACDAIHTMDMTQEDGIKEAQSLLKNDCYSLEERKKWTPEALYRTAKEKYNLQFYRKHRSSKEPLESKLEQEAYTEGKKVFDALAKSEDWSAKIIELEKLLNDLKKITENTAVLAKDIATKIIAKGNDIAVLAQDPAMQKFVTETTPIVAKKTFANDARKKELDAEIDAIASKSEYKPLIAKKNQYATELKKLQTDAKILSDGVGTQVAYTGKAIPWLIKQYKDMLDLQGDEVE